MPNVILLVHLCFGDMSPFVVVCLCRLCHRRLDVFVHPISLLSVTGGNAGPALHDRYRHVVSYVFGISAPDLLLPVQACLAWCLAAILILKSLGQLDEMACLACLLAGTWREGTAGRNASGTRVLQSWSVWSPARIQIVSVSTAVTCVNSTCSMCGTSSWILGHAGS